MAENRFGQILLPFAEKEYIDMRRACRILGASWGVLDRMSEAGLIDLIDYRERSRKKVRYQSLVDYCDKLREVYGIPDRRPVLSAPYLRHRDEDILPFPIKDTIYASQAREILGCERSTMMELCTEGRFECYRLYPLMASNEADDVDGRGRGVPWRISMPSFTEYAMKVLSRRPMDPALQ